MTTATKLRYGFGILIALLVLSSVTTILRFQSLQRNEGTAATNARIRRDAVMSLENEVLHYALAVRSFVQTKDPAFHETADKHARAVERHIADYSQLAESDREREFAKQMQLFWPAAQQRAEALYAAGDGARGDDSLGLANERAAIEAFLDEVNADAAEVFEARRAEYYRQFREIGISGFAFLIAAMIVALFTGRSVSRGIVHAESGILAEREKLRVTLSSIGDAVITTDMDGRVVFLNPVAESLTGWTLTDAIGRPLPEIFRAINEETRNPVELPTDRVLRDGKAVLLSNHTLLIRKDGTERPIDDSAAPIYDAKGKIIGVVLVFRDITERKRASDVIRQSEQHFRQMIDALPAAIYTTDPEGVVTHFNTAAREMAGREPEIGKDRWCVSWKLFKSDGTPLPLDECPMAIALKEGRVIRNEQILVERPDGTRRLADVYPTPLFDESGKVIAGVNMVVDATERRRAEEAEAHMAAIVMSSHDAIISKDLNGTIKSWNEGAQQLFGYTAEEAIGKSVTMLIPADRLDEEPRIIERVVRGERIVNYETMRRRKDGTLVEISLTVSPVRDVTGRIVGASKNARDITEQKQASQALRDSNARFSALFEVSPVGMYLVDSDLRIRMVSQKAKPSFGPIPDLIGSDFGVVAENLVPAETANELVTHFQHTLKTGQPYIAPQFYARRTDKDAEEFYDWQIHRITLPDGTYGVVCYFFDITSLVLANRDAYDSAMRHRRLFESSRDGILIVDAESGKILEANAYISAVLGIEQQDLVDKELFEIGIPEATAANKEIFRQLQKDGYVRRELSLSNSRGENVHVELIANVYHEGQRLLAQFNIRDISERFTLEKKIRQQAEILAGESRRKDEFLAMLSHELRNPLAPIRSAVYLLKMHGHENQSPVQQQACDIIERQVANLTKLVSDLLDVSRVVSGRIRLNLQTLDLRQVLDHAIQTSEPLIEQRKHLLVVKGAPGPLWTNADPTRIEEVLINLLSNAAKYTDEGGCIEVYCEQPEGQNHVQVRVRDNGMGIEPGLLPSIFDLFTQSDRSLARSEGGLGIGLNLAHRLVQLHGGTIEVQSPPPGQDKGSEFTVRLPAAVPPDAEPSTNGTNGEARVSGGRRVLVVDDNVDQVTMLVSGLRNKGYAVQSAYTGPEGLKAALQWNPDVMLLDIGLPGLSGYEVARQLRSALGESSGKMKLIALTGYGRETDVALAQEAGFDEHLTKPCDFDQLDRLLAE